MSNYFLSNKQEIYKMLVFIRRIFNIKPDKKLLGRWNNNNCQNKKIRILDYSNLDHCGTIECQIKNTKNNIKK